MNNSTTKSQDCGQLVTALHYLKKNKHNMNYNSTYTSDEFSDKISRRGKHVETQETRHTCVELI